MLKEDVNEWQIKKKKITELTTVEFVCKIKDANFFNGQKNGNFFTKFIFFFVC